MTGIRSSCPSRRDVVAGLSAAALLAGLGSPVAGAQSDPPTDLVVSRRSIEVNGRSGSLLGIMQAGGRQGLETAVGRDFRVHLVNQLDVPTLVHWHGLTPPSNQDGVPGLSQAPIGGGSAYDYAFPLKRAGTFWMHSHLGLQQQLMMAPLIVTDPADQKPDEQPVVMMLYDFSFRSAEEILAGLRKGSMAGMAMDHSGMSGMGTMPGMESMSHGGMAGMGAKSKPMQDINDIDYDAYIANDRTLADPDVVWVDPGGRVRLRVINGAAATNFHIDLGRLTGDLVAVDADPVVPVKGSRFALAAAQRADIRLELPKGAGAYPILALREGARERTGIVLATSGARIARLVPMESKPALVLDLTLERRLRAAAPPTPRRADRVHEVALMGDMMRYVWTLNGKVFGQHDPLLVKEGERVELAMRNTTMMSHPMHLHGHRFQVVAINRTRFAGAMRDTVLVPPGTSVTIAFDADNPGRWAFHCHNLYHMESGMMSEVRYGA
jgi:FtsP/CotA-like multicopper oxidase with cupredoxin domain